MKTYPFLKVLIRLYWLALLIFIGFISYPVWEIIFPTESFVAVHEADPKSTETVAISPELKATIAAGKGLFRTNCGSCHNKNMKSDMTGPALSGVRDRWSDFPITDLYNWVKNSSKMVEENHPRALDVYTEWKRSPMTSFNNLTDEDVEAILTYVESVK